MAIAALARKLFGETFGGVAEAHRGGVRSPQERGFTGFKLQVAGGLKVVQDPDAVGESTSLPDEKIGVAADVRTAGDLRGEAAEGGGPEKDQSVFADGKKRAAGIAHGRQGATKWTGTLVKADKRPAAHVGRNVIRSIGHH